MNLIDMLDLYALENESNDLFLMLYDYTLDERITRDTLNRVIIKELGVCTPFVRNTTVFKFALEEFFNKYNYNIGKLLDTMYYDYNPIENKDLQRTLNEKEDRHSVGDIDNTDRYTTDTDNTTEDTVSAYDSSSYQPKEKTTIDQGVNHNGTTTSDIVSDVDTQKHLGEHLKGKDGETSYQELIQQERDLAEFNIFNWIIQQMRRELFLLVY